MEVVLVSSDGVKVRVLRDVVIQGSLLLRDMLDDHNGAVSDDGSDGGSSEIEIPVDVIDGVTLERCISHMKYRHNNKMRDIPKPLKSSLEDCLDSRDREFISDWDEPITINMVKAACFLNAPQLQQLACAKLAAYMIAKPVEEIRAMLGVQNDFSPEEETALRKEHGMEV